VAASLETSFFSGAGLFTFLEGIPGYLLPSVCKLVILACLLDILQRMSYWAIFISGCICCAGSAIQSIAL